MNRLTKWGLPLLLLLVGIVYATTLAPTVMQIDAGELATVQYHAGIAHPSGYPLFTMLGHVFSKLPLPMRPITQLNLLSMLFSLGALAFVYLGLQQVAEQIRVKERRVKDAPANTTTKSTKKVKRAVKAKTRIIQQIVKRLPQELQWVSVLGGCLALAFSLTFWLQSTSVEVYSLHALLVSATLYCLVRGWFEESEGHKWWLLVAVCLALSFGNHLTTLVLLPGIAVLFFGKHGFNKEAFIRLGLMLAVFFPLLILIYAYLPLRAGSSPVLNWGNPHNWEYLMRHLSGFQYQVWMFKSTEVAGENLKTFLGAYPIEFGWLALVPAIAGLVMSFKQHKILAIALLVIFLSNVLYAINYDIHDISTYYLPAYLITAYWIVYGLSLLLEKLPKQLPVQWIGLGAVALMTALCLVLNYGKADQSNVYAYEDYTKAAIGSLEKDAVLLGFQWDYLISPAYYLNFVEDFRPDVGLVDKELLRRSWYYPQLDSFDPELLKGCEKDVQAFIKQVLPFERDEAHDPAQLSKYFARINTGIIVNNMKRGRPVYLGPEMQQSLKTEFQLPKGYNLIPDTYFFRVTNDTAYVPLKHKPSKVRYPKVRNQYLEGMQGVIVQMIAYRAGYEMAYGRMEEARELVNFLRSEYPDEVLPSELMQLVGNR